MASIEPTWFTAFTRQSHLLRLQSPFHLPWLLLQKFLTLQNFLLLTSLGLSSVIASALYGSESLSHTWLGIPWVANLAAFCGLYSSNYTLWSLSHVSHLLLSRYSYLYLWTFPIIPRTPWIYQNYGEQEVATWPTHGFVRYVIIITNLPRALLCFHLKRRAAEWRPSHCEAEGFTQGSIRNTKEENMNTQHSVQKSKKTNQGCF